MYRPFKKNTYTAGIKNLVKICLLFSVFFTSTLAVAPEAKAQPCNFDRADADVNCRCNKDQCRLSVIDEQAWYQVFGTDASKPSSTQFDCFNDKEEINLQESRFQAYEFENYYKKMGVESVDGKTYPKAAVDIFSNNINKQMIPEGAVCRKVGEQAFWYYDDYFQNIMKGKNEQPGAQCSAPILVTRDLFGNPVTGISTFFGCLPASVNGAVAFVLRLGLGIGTFVTVLIVLINLIKIVSSAANPDAVTEARKKMASGIFSLIALYLALTVLSIAGLQILDLGSAGGSLLRVFTGG